MEPSAKAIELSRQVIGDTDGLRVINCAKLIDAELKAAFDLGVTRTKSRARYANNVLPDDVRAEDTRTYAAGFYKGAMEQRKALDDMTLPEWNE